MTIVDAFGRPLAAHTEPELVGAGGEPLRAAPRLGESPGDQTIEVPRELSTRAKWRLIIMEALRQGWDPGAVPTRPGDELCVEVPLFQLLEALDERDTLVGLLRGRDEARCVTCEQMAEGCTCDAGTCWLCGCTDAKPCEGGCAWVDRQQRVCSSCTNKIGMEDLQP